MTTLIHTIALHIGAQGSGHRRSDVITFVSNRTQTQVIANHSMASRMYSLKLKDQCSEYPDANLSKQFYTNLMCAFQIKPEFLVDYVETPDDDGFWVSIEQFATIYMQIANLVDADMQWADSNPTTKPHHIGGYGLFL